MIRKLQKADIDRVADIWLKTNETAHDFIHQEYWNDNFELVKGMFLQAEVYVYADKEQIKGFIGLNEGYVEGIFVSPEVQSRGIGKQLMDFVKSIKPELKLSVYQKNIRAVQFYQRERFEILHSSVEESTGEAEYTMGWKSRSFMVE